MSGRTPSPSSSQQYHHQNRPGNSQQRPPAVATAPGVACPECNSLNFSSEPTCDPCRQKAAASGARSAAAASGGDNASQVVSPGTAILRKQVAVLSPRMGIVTGLRHGQPIDAYRSGGSRISSQPGARISRDGESPAFSESSAPSAVAVGASGTQSLMRSNSSSSSEQQREGGASVNTSKATQENSTRGAELCQRVLALQRQSLEAKRKASASSSVSSVEVDEKASIARFFEVISSSSSSKHSMSTAAVPSLAAASPASRPIKRPRSTGGGRDVIDLISSSDEDENDENGENDAPQLESKDRTQDRSNGAASDEAAARIPASSVAPEIVSPTAAAAAAAAAAAQPAQDDVVMSYEEDLAEAPFRSRCFPSIEFDALDFPPSDAVAMLKLRARRNSAAGVDASAAVVAAPTVAPLLPIDGTQNGNKKATTVQSAEARVTQALVVEQREETPPAASAAAAKTTTQTPASQREEQPRDVQGPAASIVASTAPPPVPDVAMSEPEKPADPIPPITAAPALAFASESASIRSPQLKRAASGHCQEQAIELGDDDEGSQNDQIFSTHGELFLSRIFQSIEFNARDFSTVHDGLHVARRSKISGQNEAAERQTQQQQQSATIPSDAERGVSTTSSRVTSVAESRSAATAAPMSPRIETPTPASAPAPARAPVPRSSTPPTVTPVPAPAPSSATPSVQPQDAGSFQRTSTEPRVSNATVAVQSTVATPAAAPPTSAASAFAGFFKPTPTAAATQDSSTSSDAAPQSASASLSSSNNRSSESTQPTAATPVTTAPPSATTTLLLARKKIPQATPAAGSGSAPVELTKAAAAASTTIRSQGGGVEINARQQAAPKASPRIYKPSALGECSAEFMNFMEDFIDGDDDELMVDEEETRKQHMQQLLEVVDLTNLTDSDDDGSSDGDDMSEPSTPRTSAAHSAAPTTLLLNGDRPAFSQTMHHPAPALVVGGPTGFFASDPLQASQLAAARAASGGVIVPVKPDGRRAARQMEPCVICEEKNWVKSMVHCKDCGKYYHKKCAKEYGDEKICWNCELDGMIDDSELTEAAHDTVVGMLNTLRAESSSSEEDSDQEGEEEEEEDEVVQDPSQANSAERSKASAIHGNEESKMEGEDNGDDDGDAAAPQSRTAMFPGSTTKSMQRWKAFLDVSTSTLDKSFHEVTQAITEELQAADERKAKYSKGFTTPEIFQAAISEVLDSYADLQDQLDREAREKPRGSASASSGAVGDSANGAPTAAEPVAGSSSSSARVILDLSGSSDTSLRTQQLVSHREVVISDGV